MKKYTNLYKEIKTKIQTGEIKAGDKLPSKRTLADKRGCSVITVEKAYSILEDEGYIISRERCGYFAADLDLPTKTPIQGNNIDLLPEPAWESPVDLEYSLWFSTVRKIISDKGQQLFVKAPGEGCAVLRNAIAEYLLRYRGMLAEPQRIIIGSGAEQLYESAVKLLGRNKIYGIEDPCYHQIPSVYGGMGAGICLLKMGDDGIESWALEQSTFDILHVTPFHSYPSGITTSISKKYEYLKWAAGRDRFIIEDDFDSEFFPPGQPIETLYSLDNTDSVLYINTFSKSLSPAMRIGYMILPHRLMDRYYQVFGGLSCSVPVMDQYVLAEFISSGSFEQHLNRMRRKLKKEKLAQDM